MTTACHHYRVLERARLLAGVSHLDILEVRKYLGVPLANDIRGWLTEQPSLQLLCIDLRGVRAVTLSVAEEIGPLLMQAVAQTPSLEQRYPVFHLRSPEPAYTFARAFANFNWAALAILEGPVDLTASMTNLSDPGSNGATVALGQLSNQVEQILTFADRQARCGKPVTSDSLMQLDFLAGVSPAARSKRLTELYARRLLAFRENPLNPKERLFIPAWRLPPQ